MENKYFTYCTYWGCGPVVISKELVQHEINEPGKNAAELFATRECESNYFMPMWQRKLHLYNAANKHNNIFFRTGALGKACVIQTGKVSKHFK